MNITEWRRKLTNYFSIFIIRNIASAANVTDYRKNRSWKFSTHVVHELQKRFIPVLVEEFVDEVGRAVVAPEVQVTVSVGRLRAGRKVWIWDWAWLYLKEAKERSIAKKAWTLKWQSRICNDLITSVYRVLYILVFFFLHPFLETIRTKSLSRWNFQIPNDSGRIFESINLHWSILKWNEKRNAAINSNHSFGFDFVGITEI